MSLGRQSLQGRNPNEVSRTLARIILHPEYDSGTSDNDIALLRLSSPVTFTDYIRPVCLAAGGSVFNNGTDSWVTGFGAVGEGGGESAGLVIKMVIGILLGWAKKNPKKTTDLSICWPLSVITIPTNSARSRGSGSGKQTV